MRVKFGSLPKKIINIYREYIVKVVGWNSLLIKLSDITVSFIIISQKGAKEMEISISRKMYCGVVEKTH